LEFLHSVSLVSIGPEVWIGVVERRLGWISSCIVLVGFSDGGFSVGFSIGGFSIGGLFLTSIFGLFFGFFISSFSFKIKVNKKNPLMIITRKSIDTSTFLCIFQLDQSVRRMKKMKIFFQKNKLFILK
jgi:hypothetical protein